MYRVPCSCRKLYIGTIKCSVNTWNTKDRQHCNLGEPEKLAVPEHVLSNEGHTVLFDEETQVLSSMRRYFPRLQMQVIEIFKHKVLGMSECLALIKYWQLMLRHAKIQPIGAPHNVIGSQFSYPRVMVTS